MTVLQQTAKPVEHKDLPVATIQEVAPGKIVLKAEMDGKDYLIELKPTPKVEDFLSNSKTPYGKGKVVEYSAKGGIVSLIRPVGGFKKAEVSKEVQKQSDVVILPPSPPQGASTAIAGAQNMGIVQASLQTQAQTPITPAPTAVNVKEMVTVTGAYDPAKITKITMSFHVNLSNYEYVEWSVEGVDEDSVRNAAVQIGGQLGNTHEPTKEAVSAYLKRVLAK